MRELAFTENLNQLTLMSTIASAVKEIVTGTETQKTKDLRADTRKPDGERMRTDHGTAITDPENWCVSSTCYFRLLLIFFSGDGQ